MKPYRITASGSLDASSDAEAQGALDAIARILCNGDGELGYDWTLDAEPIDNDTPLPPHNPEAMSGVHITITSELAIAAGEIAKRHPNCGIRIEWREGEPDELWHVGAIDGEPTDTWYVINDQDGTIVEGT